MIEVGPLAPIEGPIVDEACTSKGLSKIACLLRCGIESVKICPLGHLLAFLISFDVLFQSGQHFSRERAIVSFGYLFHLLQDVSRKADRERFDSFFFRIHASIVQQKWMHVKRLRYTLPPSRPERNGAYIPVAEARGFTHRFDNRKQVGLIRSL